MRRLQGQVVYDEPLAAIDEIPAVLANASPVPYVLPVRLPMASWRYRFVKRSIDIVGALLMFALFLIPGILIGLAMLLTSPYPVFYSEERIGAGGVPVCILLCRSIRYQL